jgi:hypothetical protein
MAGLSKQAPLEAFLNSVSGRASGMPSESEERTDGGSPADAWRLVILTLLSQSDAALSDEELASRSELGTERYRQTLERLRQEKLIEDADGGYELTLLGRELAERERARLLSLW